MGFKIGLHGGNKNSGEEPQPSLMKFGSKVLNENDRQTGWLLNQQVPLTFGPYTEDQNKSVDSVFFLRCMHGI
jgi:hypothetical protein